MSDDLKKRIKQFNEIKYPNDNSKRIIIGTLKISYKSNVTWKQDETKTGHKPANIKE